MNSKFLLALLPGAIFANRGDLLNYTKKSHVSAKEHMAICNSFSIKCSKAVASDIYHYTYETLDVDASKAQASGILIIPQNNCSSTLLVYLHGTSVDRIGGVSSMGYQMQLPLSVFTQINYPIAMPDYLGHGESSVLHHPYCHAKSLATASYDASLAAISLMKKLSSVQIDSMVLSGYSEGGMATLAMQKYLQENPIEDVKFKASCPMSGPYDLSDSLSFALNANSARMNTYISYVISSYNRIYSQILPPFNKIFSPSISYMIPILFDGCLSFFEVTNFLNKINPLLNPDFIKKTLSDTSLFKQKLEENDTYRFTPVVPTHFVALEKDTEVGFFNSIKAFNYMKKAQGPVTLENASSELDHIPGSPICHMKALEFFKNLTQ